MNDLSDAMPQGGYFLPLFPPSFFPMAANALDYWESADVQFDNVRILLQSLRDAHRIETAGDVDLDDLGAWVGVPRLIGEDDSSYRRRIPLVAAEGVSTPTCATMAAVLSASIGMVVLVEDDAPVVVLGTTRYASFTVTVLGNPGYLSDMPKLIRAIKAAGTVFHLKALISSSVAPAPLLGDFLLGDESLGGESTIVTIL